MVQSRNRLFWWPGLIAFVIAAFAVLDGARAQSGTGAWTVRDVPVDVTAENATVARERAITQGQRAAFERLVERMTLVEDKGAAPRPSDAELGAMIQNFEVQEERLSSVRYVARLAFTFRPEAVRSFMSRTGVRSADTAARPTLVLPVLQSGGGVKLWEEPNPWRDAWAGAKLGNRLTPIIAPLGDVLDVGNVSAEAALSGRVDGLPALLQRYGADTALIAVATEEPNGIKVTMSTIGQQGATPPETFSVPASGTDTPEQRYQKAVDAVAQRLEANWKRQIITGRAPPMLPPESVAPAHIQVSPAEAARQQPGTPGGNRTGFLFPISGLADWTELRSRLARLPNGPRMELKSLSRGAAEFDLVYSGDEELLRQQLAQLGLTAVPTAAGRYELRFNAGAPAFPR